MRQIVRNYTRRDHLWISRKKHVPEETYAQRIRRRNAFLAGMSADSVILVPGGVSQATASDGILYQIRAGDNARNPAPGVLPI